jgi:histidinol-phosphate aminotransferase
MIKIPKRLQSLKPYNPGKSMNELAKEKRLQKIVKLASNENPLGPSPKAMEAMIKYSSNSHRYVDPASGELVEALAAKYNKKPGQIICGHGVDSLLGYILSAFTEESDEVLTSEGSFIGIYVNVQKIGRKLTKVQLKDYCIDIDNILAHVSNATRVIYLANPNNPTGSVLTKDQFEEFMSKIPDNILVILDEAYTEYVTSKKNFPDGLSYDYENLIVARSLSKIYGLAGLRIGFAVSQEYIIRELYKIKLPFEPNYPAQKAAIAALNDNEFLSRSLDNNKHSLEIMVDKFNQLGIKYKNTCANFLLLLMPSEKTANIFVEKCLNRGLILRYLKPFGIPNGIRINSGTEEETIFAMDVIEQVYDEIARGYKPEKLESKK